MKLDTDDIKLLLEGLDALKSRAGSEGLTTMLLSTLLAPDKEAAERSRKSIQNTNDSQREQREALNESITLLEAKLIIIKQESITQNL